jgi:transcriptional regulator with XRE-family HTH domain
MPASISPARLRAARQNTGLSREAVALAVGRGWATIRNYETGTNVPSTSTLFALAELYGVTVDALLDSEPVAS